MRATLFKTYNHLTLRRASASRATQQPQQNTSTPHHPSQPHGAQQHTHLTALVLGDSYADPVDMDFDTWPHILAHTHLKIDLLCAARGGSTSHHLSDQLERAHTALRAKPGLLIIHTGGNDLLHGLVRPHMLVLLVADLLRIVAASALGRPPMRVAPRHSFCAIVSRRIVCNTVAALEAGVAKGHHRLLVSHIPLCPAVPLARTILRVLTLGLASEELVSFVLNVYASLFRRALDVGLAAFSARQPDHVRLFVFDEGHHMNDLAERAQAHRLGALGVLASKAWGVATRRLGWTSRADTGGSAAATGAAFWRDAHHPAARAHVDLCERVLWSMRAAAKDT